MNSTEIREKFINFFKENGHKLYPSSSLVPTDEDKSVLFTSAGMQQFKSWYIDESEIEESRVVSVQKCFRTSDIDEVGDQTHHTFFWMLGNFSFGYPDKKEAYFKEEAIKLAWQFLTDKKWLGIDSKIISATVFKGDKDTPKDKESRKILEKIGVKEIRELGRDDNFWGPVGKSGPCGPTVEFFVPGKKDPIEIWNLVFNQYFQDEAGEFEELGFQGVDTGMGLERVTAYLQGTEDDYMTDIFKPIIERIEEVSGEKYQDHKRVFRIIADHLRGSVFLIDAGIEPSNLGQGYILRRLIRRVVRYGNLIGLLENKLIVEEVVKIINQTDGYRLSQENVIKVFTLEEEKFNQTLKKGLKNFEKTINLSEVLAGEDLFDLYQTYGFPLELSLEIAKEKQVALSDQYQEEFDDALKRHQTISKEGLDKKFKGGLADQEEMTVKLHTVAHLLHESLRRTLGKEVNQAGQNITQERLRFDFTYSKALTDKQIKEVEEMVNDQIKKDLPVKSEQMSLDEAIKKGATALFKDRYPETVTLYSIGGFSNELCLGPHVSSTGNLGIFKIIKEESSSKGVRRIRAVLE